MNEGEGGGIRGRKEEEEEEEKRVEEEKLLEFSNFLFHVSPRSMHLKK